MKASAPIVREANEADVESLYELIIAIAEHHHQTAFVKSSVATLREDGFGRNPRFGAILAESDGELIGYATYTWNYSIWLGGDCMNIDDVFVSAAHRGKGIGEALMLGAKQVCRANGRLRMRWEVEPDNSAAIRFYERLGAKLRTKGVFGWDV